MATADGIRGGECCFRPPAIRPRPIRATTRDDAGRGCLCSRSMGSGHCVLRRRTRLIGTVAAVFVAAGHRCLAVAWIGRLDVRLPHARRGIRRCRMMAQRLPGGRQQRGIAFCQPMYEAVHTPPRAHDILQAHREMRSRLPIAALDLTAYAAREYRDGPGTRLRRGFRVNRDLDIRKNTPGPSMDGSVRRPIERMAPENT